MTNRFFYQNYTESIKIAIENKEKADNLAQRINMFKNVSTYNDAIKLANEIMPTTNEITTFLSGSAKCTVVKKTNLLRITYETNDDFICYDFS